MSKPNAIQISIPAPCSQSWEEMTLEGNGRFCAHCQKRVIDFTTYSDTALYNFFAKNNKQVCGRFLNTQISKPLQIPHQPQSRLYRLAIALGLTLLFTQTPKLLAQTRPPIAARGALIKNNDDTQPDTTMYTGSIKGKILDEKKEPMPSAVIQVFQNGVLKGGVATDFDGYYTLNNLEPGQYNVIVTYVGYDSINTNATVMAEKTTKLDLAFNKPKNRHLLGDIVVHEYSKPLIDINNPGKHTYTREEINNSPK